MSGAKMKKSPEEIFRTYHQLHMHEAIAHGITRYMLYSLRDKGIIEQVTRGIYRLSELPSISDPDLVTVSLRFPNAVICLISALFYHGITTQIPRKIHVAVSRESRIPSLQYPPVQAYKFSKYAFIEGIEEHLIDNVTLKIYNPEKTLADCFKYRNKIGMDVVLEALKYYKERKKINMNKLVAYAKICRVEKIMTPYLDTIL